MRHRYSLLLPEGYAATPGDADGSGGLSSRDAGYDTINDADFAYQLRVASQQSGDAMDAATWIAAVEKRLAETGCQGEGTPEDLRVAGEPARLYTFAAADCSHGNAEILVVTANDGRGYVFQWVAPSGEDDPKRATLDSLLASLTFA